jgi:hypothetical protein
MNPRAEMGNEILAMGHKWDDLDIVVVLTKAPKPDVMGNVYFIDILDNRDIWAYCWHSCAEAHKAAEAYDNVTHTLPLV